MTITGPLILKLHLPDANPSQWQLDFAQHCNANGDNLFVGFLNGGPYLFQENTTADGFVDYIHDFVVFWFNKINPSGLFTLDFSETSLAAEVWDALFASLQALGDHGITIILGDNAPMGGMSNADLITFVGQGNTVT